MIRKTYLNCPIVVSKFSKHQEVKKKLLSLIEKQNSEKISTKVENISNADWTTDIGQMREYWKYFYQYLKPHVEEVYDNLSIPNRNISTYWFQQYYANDFHDWHEHGNSWTNVYYLELPDLEVRTEIINPSDGSIIVPDIKEGYILTMPGILKHRSPPNKSSKRKTVVVFNIDLIV